MSIFYFVNAAFFLASFVVAQNYNISASLNQFAVKFLAETTNQAGDTSNTALSPYTVWNVMAIINEGARSRTADQIEQVLAIPSSGNDREDFRKSQQILMQNITKNYDGINLEVLNALFTRADNNLKPNYQRLVRRLYNADVTPLNFDDLTSAAYYINKKLSDGTKGRLGNIVRADDLQNTQMFIMSAFFFKGAWENRFNVSNTTEKPFYDEDNEVIGYVKMMHHRAPFPYSTVLNDKATALELAYKGNEMSLIIILPKIYVTLKSTLDMLSQTPFSTVVDALKRAETLYPTDEVKVAIPKFKIQSDFNLNGILHHMGIQDVFDSSQADLSDISSDSLFVSRIIHKADIEVDEEGTIASAVTVADLENRIQPPVFEANRPFAYFVYDKQTESIVFMGIHANPVISI